MSYRVLDHTADLGLEITATDLEGLFAGALMGLTDCVTERSKVGEELERTLAVEARDLELLMVAWLEEAVYRFEVDGLVFRRAEVRVAAREGGWELQARVAGQRFDPRRLPLKVPIKGVTYHQLRVEEREDGWTARVIFDI